MRLVVMAEGELQRVLGRNVRRVRTQRGLSQESLALALGYHRTYIGGVERGERNLSLRSVERIASQMGVEPLSLLVTVGGDSSLDVSVPPEEVGADGGRGGDEPS